ncbi:hypothetical protein SASPL_133649 [Salvia splendens]|uniref:NAC domain-containing protein n=1 Tax=Salvia splendens TaxID=180675 RepID=A0A8X8X5G9_SALSN|nr:hypothetical protein SASPL_133649 [Salvia splendens]
MCASTPGFRFHPTEEELVGYYLKIDPDVIVDIDLYRMEPCDIQDRYKLGYEEQNKWYFFSHKDRKYPSSAQMNRATVAGFWEETRLSNNHSHTSTPPSFPMIENLDHHLLFQSDGSSHIFELPKLDSPSISTSFTTNDNSFEEAEDEMRSVWNNLEKLLDSQETEPSSFPFAYSNMPLAPHKHNNDELEAHAHIASAVFHALRYSFHTASGK